MSTTHNDGKKRPLILRVLILSVVIGVVYGGILGWFSFKEDSFVYFPRKGLRNADSINIGIEQVKLLTADSVQLVAWIIPATKRDTSNPWLLYFQGNGGNISSRGYIVHYKTFRSMNISTFALGYRGYGLSEGTPSEEGLYADANAAFDYLVNVRRVPPHNIILFGFSLGSAVAIELATRVNAGGVIVEGAFMSLPSVGEKQYPFLPVATMMKNRFDSINKIRRVAEPKLFLHALHDEIIPFEHGRNLFATAGDPKTFVEMNGGHEDAHIVDSLTFYGGIAQFLERLKRSHK